MPRTPYVYVFLRRTSPPGLDGLPERVPVAAFGEKWAALRWLGKQPDHWAITFLRFPPNWTNFDHTPVTLDIEAELAKEKA